MSPRGEIHFPLYRSEVAEAGEVKKNFLQLLQRKGVVYVYVLDICSLKVVVLFFFFPLNSRVSKLRNAKVKVAYATVICCLLCICIMMHYLIVIRSHAVLSTGSQPCSLCRIDCAH